MIGNWNYGTGRRKSSVARVFMKKGTGQILGAQLFGAGAPDIIHSFALAMHARMTAEQFRHLVFAYPTFSSALESMLP